MMKQYKLYNNIFGWIAWLIATLVYVSTIEPTTSFWDCGEFIATAFKLEVGHPPGAPLFMILARFFSLFAGELSNVAMMVNILSALASSFTILFLFWSITHLAKRMVVKTGEMNVGSSIAVIGSGFVGALIFTFSDTFWFSAVEGEVYALSSLFTAVVFWAILKWENAADEKYANRWLILIAYLMGLSIGVHLLNLLAIPAIVFVYYFKKHSATPKGIVLAGIISIVLVAVVMYGIIPGAITMASYFELIFINGLGLPYNTGITVYAILLIAALVSGIIVTARTLDESKGKTFYGSTATIVFFSLSLLLIGIPLISKSILMVLPIAGIIILAVYLAKRNRAIMNTILLACTVILIGYSSFSMIVIRSLANPPMDENNPENVFALLSYLNREQYGDRPLFYGQFYNAPLDRSNPYSEGAPSYIKKDGSYVVASRKTEPNYDADYCTIFPRMFSSQPQHIKDYLKWTGQDEKDYFQTRKDAEGNSIRDRAGNVQYDYSKPRKKPSFGDNLSFFFTYQIGHMYLRYFLWNFSGRQNDTQGHGSILDGNWLSGIPQIDEANIGSQVRVPETRKSNKARNLYYMIPLIIGLIGFFFQLQNHSKGFWVVMLLFFFTGIAIVIYLNQSPHQPRERDYAYAGSFYAFSIWIGLGIFALYQTALKGNFKSYIYYGAIGLAGLALLGYMAGAEAFAAALFYLAIAMAAAATVMMFFGKAVKNQVVIATLVLLLALPCPFIMASENWDDHDRSNRYTALHFASNYLNSCAKNAIIFTNGDNDTFPLWYAQEVEGIRTDVRVVNLSLLNTDWYIDQMKRKAYESEPVPFSLTYDKYVQGTRDYAPVHDKIQSYTDINEVVEFLASDMDETKFSYSGSDERMDYIPTKHLIIPYDSAKVVSNGTVSPQDAGRMVPVMKWDLSKRILYKNDLMILDLMATNDWNRPVYFAITVGQDSYLNLEKYFQLEGLAYRIVPIENRAADGYELGRVNSAIMYDNMMNKFKWGGINDSTVFLDENNLRMTMNFRNNFARLANVLLLEGKKDSAIAVLDKSVELMPDKLVPYNYFNLSIAEVYFMAGEPEKASEIIAVLTKRTEEDLDYYFSLDEKFLMNTGDELTRSLTVYNRLMELAETNNLEELFEQISAKFEGYYTQYLSVIRKID